VAKEYVLTEFTVKCGFVHKLSDYQNCGLECLFISEYNLQKSDNNIASYEMKPVWK